MSWKTQFGPTMNFNEEKVLSNFGRLRPFVVVFAALYCTSCMAESLADTPNVVLIVADYMGASDIGPYGATDISTPSLDELASQGVRYTDFYASAPICGPSRAALMTGRYPAKIGFERNIHEGTSLNVRLPTLPSLLKQQGYTNGHFGKWHLGHSEQSDPLAHGFDEFLGYHFWSINHYTHINDSGEEALTDNRDVVEREGYLTEIVTDESIRFMQENRDNPFFIYLSYNTALPPYMGPDLPPERWASGFEDGAETRENYISMVEAMDAGIGRILDQLDDLNLTENTLVIFTYDHNGRHVVRNAPYSGGFAMLNEGGIRVPLIMRWPNNFQNGVKLRLPAINMDITATILNAAGVGLGPLGLDGLDLLDESNSEEVRSFFWRIKLGDFGQAAVRRNNWKLLVHRFATFSRPTIYLYDLESDPGESNDLYYQNKEIADRLYRDLMEWEATAAEPEPVG